MESDEKVQGVIKRWIHKPSGKSTRQIILHEGSENMGKWNRFAISE